MSRVLEVLIDGEWLQVLPRPGQAPIVNRDYEAFLAQDGWQTLYSAVAAHSKHGDVLFIPRHHACRVVDA